MKFILLFILVCMTPPLAGKSKDDFLNLISEKEWQELFNIAASISSTCIENVWTDQSALVKGVKAMVLDIAGGAVSVASEFGTSLVFKKDFPNVCHVLTKAHLDVLGSSNYNTKHCISHNPIDGTCMLQETRTHKEYSYYWPKYFIEVSEKGNDPHPAFAERNLLYTSNRKVASFFDELIDVKGPFSITSKVIAGSTILESATGAINGGSGVKMSSTPAIAKQMTETAILTPFQKLRIRANKEQNQSSYEVNIWPNALSKSMAEYLTICGDGNPETDEGGFGWPIPGVAMTCPIAMAKDAWPYWDTGMLDYLNPHAVRGIATATNPITCAADNLAAEAFDKYKAKGFGDSVGDPAAKDSLNNKISSMAPSLKGLRYCSFPIMGDTEAIYNQLNSSVIEGPESFKGPWCTMWGPMVPRNSTTVFQNDYAFANAALKFKSLAHDLFGVPRGNKERWSLAYPWEDGSVSAGKVGDVSFGKFLSDLKSKLPENIKDKFFDSNSGRSTLLAIPGDPRLIDFSFNPGTDLTNLTREVAYLASLGKMASEAEKRAIEALKRKNKVLGPTDSDSILESHDREIRRAEDVTALFDKEPIFETRTFCHASVQEKKNRAMNDCNGHHEKIPEYSGWIHKGPRFPACPISKSRKKWCLEKRKLGHCLKKECRQTLNGTKCKCKKKRKAQLLWLEKKVITGYKSVQHPRLLETKRTCVSDPKETKEHQIDRVICRDKVVVKGRTDTGEYVGRPDPKNPHLIVSENEDTEEAVRNATRISTWVGAELARAKYEEYSGRSLLPGKKRVYTIHEEVKCRPRGYTVKVGGVTKYGKCEDAIRIEIKKFVQTKLLRKICDSFFNSNLGAPFK